MPVSFRELLDTFELISATSGVAEYQAILCRQTGKIYCHSDFPDFEEFNDELPDDFENEEKYIAIPGKRELDLGKPLVLDFAREFLPGDSDEVRRIFGKRGAYQNFKRLLSRKMSSISGTSSRQKQPKGRCATGAKSTGLPSPIDG